MKKYTVFALFLMFLTTNSFAQNEEAAIKQTINNLFTGMKAGDSSITRTAFAKDCIMQTIVNKNGTVSILCTSPNSDQLKVEF